MNYLWVIFKTNPWISYYENKLVCIFVNAQEAREYRDTLNQKNEKNIYYKLKRFNNTTPMEEIMDSLY